MDGQTSIVDFLPEGEKKFVLAEDLEKAEKDSKEKIKARNRAQAIIRDAVARKEDDNGKQSHESE